MKKCWSGRVLSFPDDCGPSHPNTPRPPSRSNNARDGFTLVELLIVVTVLPLIVGAISLGLISVFSLQSGVSTRLSHTSDAQVVSANYQKDIQGASYVTTAASSTPQCGFGTGTQLMGLESDLNSVTGVFLTTISYVLVPIAGSTAHSLVRLYCTAGSLAPVSTTTLAYDIAGSQSPPTATCVKSINQSVCDASAQQWISAQNVSQIVFPVTDPSNNFPYSLVASPVASASSTATGSPVSSSSNSTCSFATPGSGTYSTSICFVDFSSVKGAALLAAQGGGCLEMSVALPNNFTLYFCLSLSGGTILPWYLPTYPQAFLGNAIGGVPFYTGIPGDPALYQRVQGSDPSVVTFSNISVVSPTGVLATGWEAISADAESTDAGESISWSANTPLTVIPNLQTGQIQPVGNACQNDGTSGLNHTPGLTGSGTTTVTCAGGNSETGGQKTGSAMVGALAPTTMTVTLHGTGLQAMTFGMLLP